MRAAYIGRFQPIHKGHLEVMKRILEEVENLVVVVAAAQISHTFKNPLTAGERIQLILDAVDEYGISRENIIIIPTQDVNDNALWVPHLMRLLPKFDIVYSNNPFTQRLFSEYGFDVRGTEFVHREVYSASEVRERVVSNQDNGDILMPSTIRQLEGWDIKGRLESIIEDDTPRSITPKGSELNSKQ